MNKLQNFKNVKLIAIPIILGIFLMVFPEISDKKTNDSCTGEGLAYADGELENKLAKLLEDTYNLDKVSVIITYDTSGEKILEYDYETSTTGADSNEKSTYQKSTISDKSTNQPFVKSERLPQVRGVLCSAQPINDDISYEIRSAVATLLGISVNKVKVIAGLQ